MTVRLTPNFTLDEFTVSQVATRMGRSIEVTPEVQANLTRLAQLVLEPIRVASGPLKISSGYRPAWLNTVIGGSKTSDHMVGLAADINAFNMAPAVLAELIEEKFLAVLPIKQVILEFNRWVHISVCPLGQEPKRELLTSTYEKGGGVSYSRGIAHA